ncbi:FMN-binding protein [Phycicoccus sonneratiae]|uniref:FMN-binding protein n=1 Tax=Phycicoccus sonneratiae TaxID=2807628 RepID=A0ABS2CMH2_9MICO|nr:FMN-binding protein [Phycicoccus sonneraticus]MBM6400376.1 FMN-binding protein [Phycicoccus sonneraticus]
MRRITTWLLSTISALVLLFSYHTSTNSGSASAVATGTADAAANGTGDTGTTGSDGTGTSDQGATDQGSTDSGTDGSDDSGATATPTPTPSTDSGSTGSDGSSGSSSGTFTGDAVQTRYGPVQVEITVAGGKITKSVVTQVPWNDHRDQEINSYAVPILNDEAVRAQSADIDMVSGATFTSDGYIQSLQSAIDQANL